MSDNVSKTECFGCLNPLGLPIPKGQIDNLLDSSQIDPSIDMLRLSLNDFFGPTPWNSRIFLERYDRVSAPEDYIPFMPYESEIVANIIMPLISAKRMFCIGEFIASIGLCGIVSEMLAVLIWELNKDNVKIKGIEISSKNETVLFGKDMQSQGQKKRIQILRELGFVDQVVFDYFDQVREERNRFLHLWDITIKINEEEKAEESLKNIILLAQKVFDIKTENGKPYFNQAITDYLQKKKLSKP